MMPDADEASSGAAPAIPTYQASPRMSEPIHPSRGAEPAAGDSWGDPVAPPGSMPPSLGAPVGGESWGDPVAPAAAPSGESIAVPLREVAADESESITIVGAPSNLSESDSDSGAPARTRPDPPYSESSPETTRAATRGAGEAGGLPRVPGYRVSREIASGGMGTVYEAEQERPRRTVALKVVKPGMATPELVRRFELEAHVLAKLRHAGIAQVFEAGTFDTGAGPQPFFAMEFVAGHTLKEYLATYEPDLRDRVELLAKICDAVEHAHRKAVIHRDLKPGNIMIDETGQPKILDFGLARIQDAGSAETMHTQSGAVLGTPYYMSPEQAEGKIEELDTRSDIFSLGAIAFEALTGRLPFDFESRRALDVLMGIILNEPVSMAAIDRRLRGDLETIVRKALEKDKERRYGSAGALADDLRHWLNDEAISARPPSPWYQIRKFSRRNKVLVGSAAAVVASLVVAVVGVGFYARSANRERIQAIQARYLADRALEGAVREKAAALEAQSLAERKEREATRLLVATRGRAALSELARGNVEEARSILALLGDVQDDFLDFLRAGTSVEILRDSVAERSGGAAMRGAVFVGDTLVQWGGIPTRPKVDPELFFSAPGDPGAVFRVEGLTATVADAAPSWRPGYAITTSADGAVREWNLAERREERTLLTLPDPANAVALSPDGKLLAVAGGKALPRKVPAPFVLLRTDTLKEVPIAGAEEILGTVYDLAFSPDGSRLAVASGYTVSAVDSEGGVALIDSADPKPRVLAARGEGTNGLSLAWAPDGGTLAMGLSEDRIQLYDANLEPLASRLSGHRNWVTGLTFSPDGRFMVSTSGNPLRPSQPGDTCVWRTGNWGVVASYPHEGSGPWRPSFSPDGSLLAYPSADWRLRVANFGGGARRDISFVPGRDCVEFAWLPDSQLLLSLGPRHTESGEPGAYEVAVLRFAREGGGADAGVAFETVRTLPLRSPAAGLLPGESGRVAYVWERSAKGDASALVRLDLSEGTTTEVARIEGDALSFALCPETGSFYTGTYQGALLRVLPKTGEVESLGKWEDPVASVAASERAGLIAAVTRPTQVGFDNFRSDSGAKSTIRILALADGEPLRTVGPMARHLVGLGFDPQGERLAASSMFEGVAIVDPVRGEELYSLRSEDSIYFGLQFRFTPDGRTLVVSGGGRFVAGRGFVEFWDPALGLLKGRIEVEDAELSGVQPDPDSGVLVGRTMRGEIWSWKP